MTYKEELEKIKELGIYGMFSFNGTADHWDSAVKSHFNSLVMKRPYYGIYIVSQKKTGQVIYIGKAGTVRQDGSFKPQDLPKRLANREKKQRRKYIFAQRIAEYGELLIEYIILNTKSIIPGYLEACLLQAYFNDYKELPADNTAL